MLFLVIGKTKVHQSGDIISLSTDLREYIAACFTAIWIQSHEHEDALAEIAQLCRDEDWRLATWDVSQGLQIAGQSQEADSTGTDLITNGHSRDCVLPLKVLRGI
jgi:hypothetical protein